MAAKKKISTKTKTPKRAAKTAKKKPANRKAKAEPPGVSKPGKSGTPFATPGGKPIAPKPSGARTPFIPPTDRSSTVDPESVAPGGKTLQADPRGPGSGGGDAVGNDAAKPFRNLK